MIINDDGRVASAAYRKRLKHWATVFCFIPSFIASSIPLSATGAKQNGLQGKIVDMTLKHALACHPQPLSAGSAHY